jgi:hypothetical protein
MTTNHPVNGNSAEKRRFFASQVENPAQSFQWLAASVSNFFAPLRRMYLRRQIERAVKRHAPIRQARAEAAKRGQHTYWRNAAKRHRELIN